MNSLDVLTTGHWIARSHQKESVSLVPLYYKSYICLIHASQQHVNILRSHHIKGETCPRPGSGQIIMVCGGSWWYMMSHRWPTVQRNVMPSHWHQWLHHPGTDYTPVTWDWSVLLQRNPGPRFDTGIENFSPVLHSSQCTVTMTKIPCLFLNLELAPLQYTVNFVCFCHIISSAHSYTATTPPPQNLTDYFPKWACMSPGPDSADTVWSACVT